MPADPSTSAGDTGRPATDWLAAVNRQSLAVRLIATTVHDVNNFLQVMSGAAEVLALDPSPAAVAKRTSSIVGQSASATAVLHALVAFVRADQPPLAATAAPLALGRQVLAYRQHAFRKLRVTASAEGHDGECAMPAPHLQQVVLNLVLNAEQALTGRTGGEIRVQVAETEGGLAIRVLDNGPGLTPAAQAAAFDWPPQPGAAPGSLGLGLRVSRALVERAHGTFAVFTPATGGTEVTLTVPR